MSNAISALYNVDVTELFAIVPDAQPVASYGIVLRCASPAGSTATFPDGRRLATAETPATRPGTAAATRSKLPR